MQASQNAARAKEAEKVAKQNAVALNNGKVSELRDTMTTPQNQYTYIIVL